MAKPETVAIEGMEAEYSWGKQVVVFSHGFGVRRDARGLFTDIVENLPEGVGYILFNYNIEKEGRVVVAPPSNQVRRLREIINWVRQQAGVLDISLIGHSMGSIAAALTKPTDLHRVILLAPPLSISRNTRNYFTGKDGAEHKDGYWTIPRTDGTISIMPDKMFDELEKLDAWSALNEWAESQPYVIVAAGADGVLKAPPYEKLAESPNVTLKTIKQASHDFEEQARDELITLVNDILLQGRKKVAGGYGGGGFGE